jgi:hypothetical protein
MVKKIFFILLISISLVSCYHENKLDVKKPENLISIDKLTGVITDLQLAEGIFVNNRIIGFRTDKEYKDSLYALIFHHYGITFEIFKKNIDYYNTDPVLMEKVYDKVLENLNKMQSKIENEAKEEAKQDTLQTDTTQNGN